jgi:hypothetical protein
MRIYYHFILPAAFIHVAFAAGYLRGDDGGIDTSFLSRRLDRVNIKASYGVINYDLFEVIIYTWGK